MKKTKIFIILLLVITTVILTNTLALASVNLNSTNIEVSNIQTLAAKKGWKYKLQNGILYKRLYNYTTGKWEGPWIKA